MLAVFLGGAIGLEREIAGKPAGLRTNILICLGSALLTDVSMRLALAPGARIADPARLAAQIVTGVGFLGAGTIMQAKGKITGLTTAATIWVVAAIGITVGAGLYFEAIGAGVLVAIVLGGLGKLEHRARRARRSVRMVIRTAPGVPQDEILDLIEHQGIRVQGQKIYDHRDDRVFELRLVGPARQYDVVRQALGRRPDVLGTSVY
ncbi:MAG TPA: MgtC/SapB family protein [Gemmatimonadaceae bacterium]|nr:MgtC/SapB family protein [Gemmatimonadaceae bacterium]